MSVMSSKLKQGIHAWLMTKDKKELPPKRAAASRIQQEDIACAVANDGVDEALD